MTVKELIAKLSELPLSADVMIGVPDFGDRVFTNYETILSVAWENNDDIDDSESLVIISI